MKKCGCCICERGPYGRPSVFGFVRWVCGANRLFGWRHDIVSQSNVNRGVPLRTQPESTVERPSRQAACRQPRHGSSDKRCVRAKIKLCGPRPVHYRTVYGFIYGTVGDARCGRRSFD
jgi:hypothetical protein